MLGLINPAIGKFCEHYNSFGRKGDVARRCGGSGNWRQWFYGQFGPDGGDHGCYQLQADF
jgi:hypothetical protein